ncbi:MAG: aminotransferase class V-fold PLP-dependent enzyme [Phycisphaerales bacterium]|nr:aminotransferase class V-fold PLP-dependent enzyme [Phycisphaerales bacterium]
MPITEAASLTRPARSPLARFWSLDPNVTFLNHGSYGVCPLPVREAQDRCRALMEQEPVKFFMSHLERLLDLSRRRLGPFLGASPTNLGFLPNATVGISTILHSIDFRPGDEILVNTHEYMSAINELARLQQRRGVRVVVQPVPFPISSPRQATEAILSGLSPRTRLAIVSHITSPTALVMPVEEIIPAIQSRGVDVLLDGAHSPGSIPVNLEQLGCAYFVATLHKWVCTPKGAGVLYARSDRQGALRPLALSSRAHQPRADRALFLRDFDYLGTDDYSPAICAPDAIDFGASLFAGGWPELMQRNHDLVCRARRHICDELGITDPAPESMVPTMASIPLPPIPERLRNAQTTYGDPLQDRLVKDYGIQVPVWTMDLTGQRLLRISAQAYNTFEEYVYLAGALKRELDAEQN